MENSFGRRIVFLLFGLPNGNSNGQALILNFYQTSLVVESMQDHSQQLHL